MEYFTSSIVQYKINQPTNQNNTKSISCPPKQPIDDERYVWLETGLKTTTS